ncbi:MAG: twin-arginine translocase subunit TatC [Chloroflexota bacterium]
MATVNETDLDLAGETFSILEHLNELRVRLTWAAGGIAVGTVISFLISVQILELLLQPYGGQLQTLSPTEGLETFFRVAFASGIIMSMPFTVYQMWLFIEPALTKPEKRYVFIFFPVTLGLFALGVWFAWQILVPAAVNFLSDFLPEIFVAEWTGQEYIDFIMTMILWLGLSFEMPVIFYFVGRFGLMTAKTLADQWRYAVIGVAVLAAAITPSIDPITMLLTMAPLLILFFVSIGTTKLGQRQFERSMTY